MVKEPDERNFVSKRPSYDLIKETEDDILNKYEIEEHGVLENMNVDLEDNLLNDGEDEAHSNLKKVLSSSENEHQMQIEETNHINDVSDTVNVKISATSSEHEENCLKKCEQVIFPQHDSVTSNHLQELKEDEKTEPINNESEKITNSEEIKTCVNAAADCEDKKTEKIANTDLASMLAVDKSEEKSNNCDTEFSNKTKGLETDDTLEVNHMDNQVSANSDENSIKSATISTKDLMDCSQKFINEEIQQSKFAAATKIIKSDKLEKNDLQDDENTRSEKNTPEKDRKEIFNKQTMDAEDLLEIVDVKPVDENNLMSGIEEVSSSENSEKEDIEDDGEELENEKFEDYQVDYDETDETIEDKGDDIDDTLTGECKNDEAGDAIDIEENTLRDENFCDNSRSLDSSVNSEKGVVPENNKIDTDNITVNTTDKLKIGDQTKELVSDSDLSEEMGKNKVDAFQQKNIDEEASVLISKPTKRSISETEEEEKQEVGEKRIKLSDTEHVQPSGQKDTPSTRKVESLNCLVEFMKSKVLTKLTRDQLEQLCLQKMCEAVVDKSEIGELRHQLKVQEQTVEHWRKEVSQLTKQARDLETVNNRLMSDFRNRQDKEKAIMPLKITRSVGLQVNPENFLSPNRRKGIRINQPSLAQSSNSSGEKIAQQNASSPSSSPTKQAKVVQQNGITALDTSKDNTTASANKQTENSGSFIDLTNEDDKKANDKRTNNITPPKTNNAATPKVNNSAVAKTNNPVSSKPNNTTPVKTNNSTASTKSFRIVSPAVASSVGVTTTNPPRLMYVFNSPVQNIISSTSASGQKSVMKVNANGVIGQTNNVRTVVQNGNIITQVSSSQSSTVRPIQSIRPTLTNKSVQDKIVLRHPAPLPATPVSLQVSRKPVPPKPHLQIRKNGNAIVLSWKMPYNLNNFETIASYQLYAYQETSAPPTTDMWRKVGDIKALALPMACTLTQFADGNKYHFAVRAVDVLKRVGPFSDPGPILL